MSPIFLYMAKIIVCAFRCKGICLFRKTDKQKKKLMMTDTTMTMEYLIRNGENKLHK